MIPTLDQIAVVEAEYCSATGQPSLGRAYAMLKARWDADERDLETGLRFLFLAWYACSEPPFLTGLYADDTASVFNDVFTHFGGTASTEPELLFAVGLMAGLFPWCCGSEPEWSQRAHECTTTAARLKPAGFPASHIEGRGAYGQYFAHMVTETTGDAEG